jgi:hypothetical protein
MALGRGPRAAQPRPAGLAPAAAEHPEAAFFEDRRSRFALYLLTARQKTCTEQLF